MSDFPPPFELSYFDPPEGLEREILTLFSTVWREKVVKDRHPGANCQVLIVTQGSGTITFGSRQDTIGPGPLVYSGFDHAAPFVLDGPYHCIGVSLSPFGWAGLTQKPANLYCNQVFPAGQILGPEFDGLSERLVRQHRSNAISDYEVAEQIAEWIRPRLQPIPKLHLAVIEKTLAWLGTSLNPPVEELFETQPYSRKQVERLVLRYFGFSPAAIARKYRAIRAANLLARRDLTDEGEAAIASAFFDQPHMIREIRRFCGHTPSRLGGTGDPMFHQLLKLKNMDRLREFRSIGLTSADAEENANDSQQGVFG